MFKRNREREKLRTATNELGTGSSDSILAALYQRILIDLGIGTSKFTNSMEKFLSDPRNGYPQNIKERSSARGNLRKELFKVVMTWKVFCKGIRFLEITKFKVSVELHHPDGRITIHSSKPIILEDYPDGIPPKHTKQPS